MWIKGNFYWPDLNNYFQRFDSEQIHVILFDDLKANSEKVVKSVYSFLGVDTGFVPDLTAQNTGGIPNNDFLYRFALGSRNLLKKLGTPPAGLRSAWSEMKKKLLIQAELDLQIRGKILEVCRDDILRTQELIRRDLAMWLK
jgi:hypothetical protein